MEKKEEVSKEAVLSAALVRDIVSRHINADVDINESECPCGFCQKTIPKGRPAIFVKAFDGKTKIALCDKECKDANEYGEMRFFGCANLENLPPIERKTKKMRRSDLVYGYHCRLQATQQDHIDKITTLRKAYQLHEEE